MRRNGYVTRLLLAIKVRPFFWLLLFLAVIATVWFALQRSTAGAGDLGATPRMISFGSVAVGQMSTPGPVTLRTYFWAPIGTISTTGDFSQTNNCPPKLPLYGRCRVLVTFSPRSVEPSIGLLTVAGPPTISVRLSGTGARAVPTATPTPTSSPTAEPTGTPTPSPTPTPDCHGQPDGAACPTGLCFSGMCFSETCFDMVQDGDETDVDCGGSCPPCATGKKCRTNTYCISGVCNANICVSGP